MDSLGGLLQAEAAGQNNILGTFGGVLLKKIPHTGDKASLDRYG